MPDNHCCCDIPPPPPCTHVCIFQPAGCLSGWDYWVTGCTVGVSLCRQGSNPCFTGALNPPAADPALPPAANEICPMLAKLCFNGGWVLSWSFDGGQTWSSANFGGTLAGLSTGYCLTGTPLGAIVCIGGMACPTVVCGLCRSDKPVPTSWVVDMGDVTCPVNIPPGNCPTQTDACGWFAGAHVLTPYGSLGACAFLTVSPCCTADPSNPNSCFYCNLACWTIAFNADQLAVVLGQSDPFGVGHVGQAGYSYTGAPFCPVDCSQIGKSEPPLTLTLGGFNICSYSGLPLGPCCNWPATIQVRAA